MKDLEVIFTEEYDDWQTARQREKYLKSAVGRRFLKKKISAPVVQWTEQGTSKP